MGYEPYIAPSQRPHDLNPEAFSDVGGGQLTEQVGTIFDYYAPNEQLEVLERHGVRPGFRALLSALGFRKGCSAPTLGHYEYPWREDLLRVGTIVTAAGGPGNNMVIELDPASMFDAQQTQGGAARQGSYIREHDTVLFPDGSMASVIQKDVSSNPHRITLRPVKDTYDLDNSVTAGESYFINSNAFAEGSCLPRGLMTRTIKYNNCFQIVKEYSASTGSELTNKTYFRPVPGKEGSYYMEIERAALRRFEQKRDGALMFGQKHNNVNAYVNSNDFDTIVKGTEGMIDFATLNGYTDYYVPGTYTLQDFDVIGDIYEDERASSMHILAFQGRGMYLEVENMLLQYFNPDVGHFLTKDMLGFSGTDVPGGGRYTSDKDWAAAFGFYAVRKGGYNFCFKQLADFNNVKGAGAAGYDFGDWSIMCPLGTSKNKLTGEAVPTIGYEYKKLGNYSRESVIAMMNGVGVAGTGGYGRIAVHGCDITETGYVSELAFHGTLGNQMVIQRPQP